MFDQICGRLALRPENAEEIIVLSDVKVVLANVRSLVHEFESKLIIDDHADEVTDRVLDHALEIICLTVPNMDDAEDFIFPQSPFTNVTIDDQIVEVAERKFDHEFVTT